MSKTVQASLRQRRVGQRLVPDAVAGLREEIEVVEPGATVVTHRRRGFQRRGDGFVAHGLHGPHRIEQGLGLVGHQPQPQALHTVFTGQAAGQVQQSLPEAVDRRPACRPEASVS